MSVKNLTYPYLTNIFENITSEKIGFYFSFCFHLIFLIIVIGFPSFFDPSPIIIPTVIPIEIINIAETTSIPKKIDESRTQEKIEEKVNQKKFNNLQSEQAKIIKESEITKSIQTKITSTTDIKKINIKEQKKVEQDMQILTKADDKSKDTQEEKFESLPTKKIKPKIKPQLQDIENTVQDIDIKIKPKPSFDFTITEDTDIKAKVKSKPKPSFDISSMLKDLRNDQTVMNKEKTEKNSKQDKIIKKNESKETEAQLSISEIDLLMQQLSSCWSAPAGAVVKKGMVVKISAKIKPDRKVLYESVRIVDTNIPQSNPFFGPITESAMRTLLNPECSPLRLPAEKYDLWKNLTIIFDHSIMKGYQ